MDFVIDMGPCHYFQLILHTKDTLVASWKAVLGSANKLMIPETKPKFFIRSMFEIRRKNTIFLNTKTRPCEPSYNYSLTNCLELEMMKRINCQLPWLSNESGFSNCSQIVHYLGFLYMFVLGKYPRTCDAPDDLEAYVNLTSRIESLPMDQITEETKCLPPCEIQNFEPLETAYQFDLVDQNPNATKFFESDRYSATYRSETTLKFKVYWLPLYLFYVFRIYGIRMESSQTEIPVEKQRFVYEKST